jgi:hypothetical protein
MNKLYARLPNPAFLDITQFKTSDDYFKACDVDVRTSFRKCQKQLNYVVKEYTDIKQQDANQLYEIWTSIDVRQNRPINLLYEPIDGKPFLITKNSWPVQKYTDKNRMFIMEFSDKFIAYLELYIEDRIAVIHSTLGHYDYLKYGIMKTLFFTVIKDTWGEFDKLAYGPKSQGNHFKRDLLII